MQTLLLIEEVAALLRCSVPTVRRRLAERRAGIGAFPLPITRPKQRARWRSEDVENWNESVPDVLPPPESPLQRGRRMKVIQNELARLGVKISKQK